MKKKPQSPSHFRKQIDLLHAPQLLGGIVTALLLVSTALFIYQGQQTQDNRSRAAVTRCDISDSEIAVSAEEQEMLKLVNEHRQKNGAEPLEFSVVLNRAAAWHSNDMHKRNQLEHNDSLGRTPQARMKECGVIGDTAENIAYHKKTPNAETIFNSWKTSSEHNANMLSKKYKTIGIAQVGIYWTQDFSSSDDGGTVVAPTSSTQNPTSAPTTVVVPSPNCLGGCPTVTLTPSGFVIPTVDPAAPALPGTPTTGGGGLLDLIMKLIEMLLGNSPISP